MKLYELAGTFNDLYAMVENDDIDIQAIEDTLEGIELEINEKAANIAAIIKMCQGDVETIKAEEQRLNQKRKTLEIKANKLKDYLKENLELMGVNKVGNKLFTVSLQNNPQSVLVNDENTLKNFEKYWKPQEPVLDRKQLFEDLKNGLEIEGAVLQQTKSIRIR